MHTFKLRHWTLVGISIVSTAVDALHSSTPSLRRSLAQKAPHDWPIKNGYVAFGDSYAAGLGTGTTSVDKCRVGSNNYGNLLMQYTDNPQVYYQPKQCSGDNIVGVAKQIDSWHAGNSTKADLATLSVGGNDVWFSDFVKRCILTINPLGSSSGYREDCLVLEARADNYLRKGKDDQDGLRFKLKTQYLKIMRFSGREVRYVAAFKLL